MSKKRTRHISIYRKGHSTMVLNKLTNKFWWLDVMSRDDLNNVSYGTSGVPAGPKGSTEQHAKYQKYTFVVVG